MAVYSVRAVQLQYSTAGRRVGLGVVWWNQVQGPHHSEEQPKNNNQPISLSYLILSRIRISYMCSVFLPVTVDR